MAKSAFVPLPPFAFTQTVFRYLSEWAWGEIDTSAGPSLREHVIQYCHGGGGGRLGGPVLIEWILTRSARAAAAGGGVSHIDEYV